MFDEMLHTKPNLLEHLQLKESLIMFSLTFLFGIRKKRGIPKQIKDYLNFLRKFFLQIGYSKNSAVAKKIKYNTRSRNSTVQ